MDRPNFPHVLITGGAGFIGSRVTALLASRGCRVTVLDALTEQIHGRVPQAAQRERIASLGGMLVVGDVTDRAALERALDGQDAVIHLAAETGTGQSMYEIDRYTRVNVGGSALLLDILANAKHSSVRKLIVASSRAIYGEGKHLCPKDGVVYPGLRRESDMLAGDFECHCPLCGARTTPVATSEDSRPSTNSYYAVTKLTQENLFLLAGKTMGVEAAVLRYQNVYGPGQSLKNPYTGIMSIFSSLIREGHDLNIFEDGMESRDFVYVEDVAGATAAALECREANGKIFNVGTGAALSVLDIARTLQKYYGKNGKLNVTGNFRLGDIRHNFADLSALRTILHYEPKWDFSRGSAEFARWVDTQETSSDGYEKSLAEMRERNLYK